MSTPRDDPSREVVVSRRVPVVVDASIGVAAVVAVTTLRAALLAARVARPFVGVVMKPPLVNPDHTPEALMRRVAAHGTAARVAAEYDAGVAARVVVPLVTDAVVSRIDLTDLVLSQVDLRRVVEAALDSIDLTELVLRRVDLDRVVASVDLDAAVADVDLDAAVARVDLVGIADYLVEAIDLPEIIRTSTGSVATEAVRGVRMQSIDADARVQQIVDRVLLRRFARKTQAPAQPDENARDANEDGSA